MIHASILAVAHLLVLAQAKPESIEGPGNHPRIDLVLLPGGKIQAGAPAREIFLLPFRIGAREVTWADFAAFQKATRRGRSDVYLYLNDAAGEQFFKPDHPAVGLTWHTALSYCDWLSKATGRYFRLPTELEWEYAQSGGGDQPASLDRAAWHEGNSGGVTHPVGTKEPNGFGLYDMLGNASEYILEAGAGGTFSPVLRGGSFDLPPGVGLPRVRETLKQEWSEYDAMRPRSLEWLAGARPCQGMRLVQVAGPEDREIRERTRSVVQVTLTESPGPVELKVGGGRQDFVRVKGEVQNSSKESVLELELQVYLLDSKGRPHLADAGTAYGRPTWTKIWPVLMNVNQGDTPRTKLAPGEKRTFEALIPASFDDEDDVPAGKFGAQVTNLRLGP